MKGVGEEQIAFKKKGQTKAGCSDVDSAVTWPQLREPRGKTGSEVESGQRPGHACPEQLDKAQILF